jgi:UDP-2-acetamido-2-deoxy-ribo-hexuluronate aminotransferase
VFKNLGYNQGDFPVAEKVANQCLSLPMSPYLSEDDQTKVIDAISAN